MVAVDGVAPTFCPLKRGSPMLLDDTAIEIVCFTELVKPDVFVKW